MLERAPLAQIVPARVVTGIQLLQSVDLLLDSLDEIA